MNIEVKAILSKHSLIMLAKYSVTGHLWMQIWRKKFNLNRLLENYFYCLNVVN